MAVRGLRRRARRRPSATSSTAAHHRAAAAIRSRCARPSREMAGTLRQVQHDEELARSSSIAEATHMPARRGNSFTAEVLASNSRAIDTRRACRRRAQARDQAGDRAGPCVVGHPRSPSIDRALAALTQGAARGGGREGNTLTQGKDAAGVTRAPCSRNGGAGTTAAGLGLVPGTSSETSSTITDVHVHVSVPVRCAAPPVHVNVSIPVPVPPDTEPRFRSRASFPVTLRRPRDPLVLTRSCA